MKTRQLKGQMEMEKDFGIKLPSPPPSPLCPEKVTSLPIVVNLFGAPGAGKSTGAAYIFAMLKMAGFNAELITEYAKDKTWEENFKALKNQAYLFGEQSYKMSCCADKVDVIVTDSPLLLNIVYNNDSRLTDNFNATVVDVFNSYCNMNYFITRRKKYNPVGRNQSESEASQIGQQILKMLNKNNFDYENMEGSLPGYNYIANEVGNRIRLYYDTVAGN